MSVPRNPDRESEETQRHLYFTQFLIRWEGDLNDYSDSLFLVNTDPSNIRKYNLLGKKEDMTEFHTIGTYVILTATTHGS
jgi:hypothetical protein